MRMKRYLIVKISAIGDVIMAMPMVRELKRQKEPCHITWLCGRTVLPLLEQLPIDELIPIDEKKLLRGTVVEKIMEVLSVWKKLAFSSFDTIAIGHADPRYKVLTVLTRSKVINSFSHQLGASWPIPGRHHTDEYVRLVLPRNPGTEPIAVIRLTPPSDPFLVRLIHGIRQAGTQGIIVLTPGGAKNLLADDGCRRWPIENYRELARLLMAKGYSVVIVGANSDEWILPYFKDLPVVNLVGKTNLIQLLFLFSQVNLVVTHDSGTLHLAGSVDCNLVALFGPTSPKEKLPRRDKVYYFWNEDQYACCPCYDGKFYAKCDDNICLRSITPEKVFKMIRDILG
jgi:heptosyltransferase II